MGQKVFLNLVILLDAWYSTEMCFHLHQYLVGTWFGRLERLGQIDPHIGIMVKTPKPIQVAILGPKNYRFGLRDPDLNYGDDICKYLEYL